jgi:hypothetical protein
LPSIHNKLQPDKEGVHSTWVVKTVRTQPAKRLRIQRG